MSTVVADAPQASAAGEVGSAAPAPPQEAPPGGASLNGAAQQTPGEQPLARSCERCGSPLADDQDWCLQCGAGAPGSLSPGGWRPAAAVLVGVVLLVLAAAGAGYAALNKSAAKAPVRTLTVAQAVVPATPTTTVPPATPAPTATVPVAPVTPPKIPLTTSTPKATVTPTTPAAKTPATTTPAATGGEEAQTALVLDTNAAKTYNPYNYPESNFGDPSLVLDGDISTGWTAQLEPAVAPRMAEGVLLDLKTPQKLSALKLITSTPGMTVQVYGANGTTVASSITDKAWTHLSHSLVVHKRHTRIKLLEPTQAFRYVTLWISRAPASAVGTPEAPGHVTVNEIELFS